ncbi:MAG: hypothetical protein R3F59_02055 [Myxococcota bacterium]
MLFPLLFAAAHAAPEMPVPVANRPATIPRATVRVDADTTIGTGSGPVPVDLAAGFGVGVTDQFELGAQVLPLDLAPGAVQYLSPSLYATYGAELSKVATFAPTLRVFVPIGTSQQALLDGKAMFRFNADRALRLDVGGVATVAFDEQTATALAAPLSLTVSPDKRVFLTADTAISTDPTDTRFRMPRPTDADGVYVPLGASIGTTFGRANHTLTDVAIGAHLPSFAHFHPGGTDVTTDDLTVMASLSSVIPTDAARMERRHRPVRNRPVHP